MNWSYLFKHWFGTLFITPLICDLSYYCTSNTNRIFGLVEMFPYTLLFSFFFSIPTYVVYGCLFYFLIKNNATETTSKIILVATATIGITITYLFLFNSRELLIYLGYITASVITGTIFKIKK